jgi:toxin ParE1/3/4
VKVRWTVSARADLLEVVEYVFAENPDAAVRMRSRIRHSTRHLVEHPEIGRIVPELGDPTLRELVIPPYRVVYLVLSDEFHIMGVIHSKRLMPDFEKRS